MTKKKKENKNEIKKVRIIGSMCIVLLLLSIVAMTLATFGGSDYQNNIITPSTKKAGTTPKPTGNITPRPATPRPATPRPATPKPATPRPATPKPATPRPATPKPATPRPATPRPATPRPATPGPTGTTQTAKVKITCPYTVMVGEVFQCHASGLISGDSVKEWNICSTIFVADGNTKSVRATRLGSCTARVTTKKGAIDIVTITIREEPKPTGNTTSRTTPRPTSNTTPRTTPRPTVNTTPRTTPKPTGNTTPRTTPTPVARILKITCDKTNITIGDRFTCTVNVPSGDKVAKWTLDNSIFATSSSQINLTASGNTGGRVLTVTTENGKSVAKLLYFMQGNVTPKPSGNQTPRTTPKPTGDSHSLKINCTTPVVVGDIFQCQASGLSNGDSVKEWNICSTKFTANGNTKTIKAAREGSCVATVKTTKGAVANTIINIVVAGTKTPSEEDTPKVSITCNKQTVRIGEEFICSAALQSGDRIKEWSMGNKVFNQKSMSIVLLSGGTAGTKIIQVETVKGAKATAAIVFTNTSSVSIKCDKTTVSIGDSISCTATLLAGDSIKEWSMGSQIFAQKGSTITLRAAGNEGIRILKATTNKGHTVAIALVFNKPQQTTQPVKVSIKCDKTKVRIGDDFSCTAILSSGDSVKEWSMGENVFSQKGETINLQAAGNAGTKALKVVTTKGATAAIAITMMKSDDPTEISPEALVVCDKKVVKVGEDFTCNAIVPEGDMVKSWRSLELPNHIKVVASSNSSVHLRTKHSGSVIIMVETIDGLMAGEKVEIVS